MSGAYVFLDRSQFPEHVREDLLGSLRARAINHKFHYDSYKQAAKWLALHEAHSPARRDDSCLRIYDDAFRAAATVVGRGVHVIGLGCGGGQKEARLLEVLGGAAGGLAYTASDVSLPLVLTAMEAAAGSVSAERRHAVVCDLATTTELGAALDGFGETGTRLITLFGIIPNFDPDLLMARISALLRPGDVLVLSANLAPGADYAAGVRRVLPQYDNELTRDWLLTLLLDLGFEREDGGWCFSIETADQDLQRIAAHFELARARDIRVYGERFSFAAGERIRVFFSYRHTLESMRGLLARHGIQLRADWINDSGEEGVFLCRKGA